MIITLYNIKIKTRIQFQNIVLIYSQKLKGFQSQLCTYQSLSEFTSVL